MDSILHKSQIYIVQSCPNFPIWSVDMSHDDRLPNRESEGGDYWVLKSERRRPKREFIQVVSPAAPGTNNPYSGSICILSMLLAYFTEHKKILTGKTAIFGCI